MNDTFFVSIVTFAYFSAAFVFLVSFIFEKKCIDTVAVVITVAGLVIQTLALIIRWIHSYQLGIGHAPLSNFYESLVFFSWSIIFIYMITRKRYGNTITGTLATFFSFLILAYASLSGKVDCRIQPLIPALQSNWLISHVISSFLAYACFAIAFGTSILYLVKRRTGKWNIAQLPDAAVLDEIMYKMISIGFVLLTLGIITGAAWADRAWGRYWGWDPKETWSLITWLIYGAFLHARLARGWKGIKMSLISIIGFLAVIFTYLGVNYILSGLHSYL
ncbi:MAG: c-type cytochrome biogenesis protein CcsB [Deltaproteobacteria bacterium]|nr:c-type cytochrome biogenesis protein CcsB [Deltaproteobacteria bacterium]